MKQQKLFFLFIPLAIISCTDKIIGYTTHTDYPREKKAVEIVKLNPADMFYLRFEEYFDVVNTADNDDVGRYNQSSVRLYRSISVDETKELAPVVEEKYLYMENYSNTLDSSGRLIYFKTTKFFYSDSLRSVYKSDSLINLGLVIEANLGYWHIDPKNGRYRLLMTNGYENFQVEAIRGENKLIFYKISHPNYDRNSRNKNGNQMIRISQVMNVEKDSGLVYYRNVDSKGKFQRNLIFETAENRASPNTYVSEIHFVYDDRRKKEIRQENKNKEIEIEEDENKEKNIHRGVVYYKLSSTATIYVKKNKPEHAGNVIPVPDRQLFKNHGIVRRFSRVK